MSKHSFELNSYPLPILSSKGIALLSLGLIFPSLGILGLVDETSVQGLLLTFYTMLLAFLVLDYFKTRVLLKNLELEVELKESTNSGSREKLKIDLKHNSLRDKLYLSLRPAPIEQIKFEQEILSSELSKEIDEQSISHLFTPLQRGIFSFNQIFLRTQSSLKFWSWQYRITFKNLAIQAWPNQNIAAEKSLKSFQKALSGSNLNELYRSEGREFDSLRKYSIGDDLRKVDWKRSARGRGMLVKNYRPESHQRISIAIDCSRRMSNIVGERQQIEYALDAAAHLLKLSHQQEDEVGFFAFHHKVIAAIPCKKGRKQEKLLLRTMQDISTSSLEPDYQLLSEWAQAQKKRTLLVLLSSISNPISLDAIKNILLPLKKKHLIVLAALADRDLQKLCETKARSLKDAYIIAAANEQLSEIRKRQKQIQALGIECIYCDVADLGLRLREKYQELKVKGRL